MLRLLMEEQLTKEQLHCMVVILARGKEVGSGTVLDTTNDDDVLITDLNR